MQAVGEPPLFLAASVLFAIRDAVTASREDRSITTPFQLHTPATCEAIRMACADQFTQQVYYYTHNDNLHHSFPKILYNTLQSAMILLKN